jgi:hypothetical protein
MTHAHNHSLICMCNTCICLFKSFDVVLLYEIVSGYAPDHFKHVCVCVCVLMHTSMYIHFIYICRNIETFE